MIYQLIRRDPAWLGTLFMVAFTTPMLALGHVDLVRIICCVMPVFMFGAIGKLTQPERRCGAFEATLPLRTSDLFAARILSLLSAIWLPVIAGVIVIEAQSSAAAGYLIESGALLTLALLITQSVRPRSFAAPKFLWTALWICTLIVWALLLRLRRSYAGSPQPSLIIGICLPVSLLLFVKTWRALPESFQVADQHPGADWAMPKTHFYWSPVMRSMLSRQTAAMCFAGLTFSYSGGCPFTLCWISFVTMQLAASLRWLSTLPFSRRKLLLLTLAPGAVVLAGSVVIAAFSPEHLHSWPLTIPPCPSVANANQCDMKFCPRVSPAYWSWSIGNPQPMIRALWGETCAADARHFLGVTMSNPWTVRAESSRRFLDWQLARASQAIYGGVPTSETLHQSTTRIRPLVRRSRMVIGGIGLILALYLAIVFVMHCVWWVRMPARPSTRKWILAPLAVVLVLGGLLAPLWEGWDFMLFHLSFILPQSIAGVIAVMSAVLLALYWLLEKQFNEVELPTRIAALDRVYGRLSGLGLS